MLRNDVINYASSLSGEAGHTEVLRIYNSQKTLPRGYAVRLNDPWCATFVSACFLKYGYSDISECSCDEMIKKEVDSIMDNCCCHTDNSKTKKLTFFTILM